MEGRIKIYFPLYLEEVNGLARGVLGRVGLVRRCHPNVISFCLQSTDFKIEECNLSEGFDEVGVYELYV